MDALWKGSLMLTSVGSQRTFKTVHVVANSDLGAPLVSYSRGGSTRGEKVKFSIDGKSEILVKLEGHHLPSTYGDSLAGLSMQKS